MKAEIRDCRVGRPIYETPAQRYVTIDAYDPDPSPYGATQVTLVLNESEARRLYKRLTECVTALDVGYIDIGWCEHGATLPIAPKE